DPKYDKLITSLRTAYANELSLDKKQTSYDDLLDALRLALKAGMIRHPDIKFAYKDRNFSRTKFIIKRSFVKNLLFCKSLYFTTRL
ncbi:MAG TPA: hypothetical protein VNB67_10955, partial [Nitrososphaeraceae archaeon]|nr:hypothetical protein [Nitrososphaeraceae archaeon]